MLWNIAVNDAGAEYDPLTLLRTRTMYGRPDWKAIYGRIRMAIEAGSYLPGHGSALKSRVGVSASLPNGPTCLPTDFPFLYRLTSAALVDACLYRL
jgi:NADPH oxidase